MANPSPVAPTSTPSSVIPPAKISLLSVPNLTRCESSVFEDVIWNRLEEAGFDEDLIKRRDKALIIAYISKLEAEVFEYQHHMGLLILEKKEWESKYQQVRDAAETAKAMHKHDQSTQTSALAEARKREEHLKRALDVEKECVSNIERALHEVRKECAETKLDSETKLAEAQRLVNDVEKKFLEAEAKLHAVELFQAESNRYHSAAERKLMEVEAREDELRRRRASLNSEYEAKEKEIDMERQHIYEDQKILQQEEERLLDRQVLLDQKEELVNKRAHEVDQLKNELKEKKEKTENMLRYLETERSDSDLRKLSLETREAAVFEREVSVNKKEQELLVLQERLLSKEFDEFQKLVSENQASLEVKRSEFEAEIEEKRKVIDAELKAQKDALELKENMLKLSEEKLQKMSHEAMLKCHELMEKENAADQKSRSLEEKEQKLIADQQMEAKEKLSIQKEREKLAQMKLDFEKYKDSINEEKDKVLGACQKLEITESERDELRALQVQLKDELDRLRAQNMMLNAKADELKAEKERFEAEWLIFDEKAEDLRLEAKRVAAEKEAALKFLQEEQQNLKLEKDLLRVKFNEDIVSLRVEHDALVRKMEVERADWLKKIQQERDTFIRDAELQRRELEICVTKRQEEIEMYLKEKEGTFEIEKAKELELINFQRRLIDTELKQVALERSHLEDERAHIFMERERIESELAEIKSSIDELRIQREKLQEQRELLHKDRENISLKMQQFNDLELLKFVPENTLSCGINCPLDIQDSKMETSHLKDDLNAKMVAEEADLYSNKVKGSAEHGLGVLPLSKTTSSSPLLQLSWIKVFTEKIFKQPSRKCDGHGSGQRKNSSKLLSRRKEQEEESLFKFLWDTDNNITNMNSQDFVKDERAMHFDKESYMCMHDLRCNSDHKGSAGRRKRHVCPVEQHGGLENFSKKRKGGKKGGLEDAHYETIDHEIEFTGQMQENGGCLRDSTAQEANELISQSLDRIGDNKNAGDEGSEEEKKDEKNEAESMTS